MGHPFAARSGLTPTHTNTHTHTATEEAAPVFVQVGKDVTLLPASAHNLVFVVVFGRSLPNDAAVSGAV
jgi:hypothetical protein